MSLPAKTTGLATIALAIGFNVPFALLGASFGYPDILRAPAATVLQHFHDGGAGLVLTWYMFMLSAALMVPVAAALAAHLAALRLWPAARVIALSSGVAAGILQAIGLSRWVFAVPALARIEVDPAASESARAQAEATFELINNWGGVAIGEQLGQIFTVAFVGSIAIAQLAGRGLFDRVTATAGLLASLLIAIGLGEGVALAAGTDPGILGLFTVAGYMAFTLWLLLTGTGLVFRLQPITIATAATV